MKLMFFDKKKASILYMSFLVINAASCQTTSRKGLMEAYEEGDKQYCSNYYNSMATELDFARFMTMANDFGYASDFPFGTFDLDSDLERFSKEEQEIIRYNTLKGYSLYIESCLFMSRDLEPAQTVEIQREYYKTDSKFTESEIGEIKKAIAALGCP